MLEERDVQIRGYKVRLPLDVMLVASANPEDYTNRGRIITPLKDRFGAQIRTHYPLDVDTEIDDRRAGGPHCSTPTASRSPCPSSWPRSWPTLSHAGPRTAPTSTSAPGVSVRLTVANYETLVANAVRRALRAGETEVVPRISDLDALGRPRRRARSRSSTLDEGATARSWRSSLRSAVLTVFRGRWSIRRTCAERGRRLRRRSCIVDAGEDVASPSYAALLDEIPALPDRPRRRPTADESPAAVAGAVEFILEGLHLSKRLNKEAVAGRAVYQGRQ